MEDFCEVKLAFATTRQDVERVGAAYLNATRLASGVLHEAKDNDVDKLPDDEGQEAVIVDINYLKSLDPKEWKDQDHYKVLGLDHLRFNASDDDIRRAYRRMVLLHHPDKRKAKGEAVNQDTDYFTCITKAYEMLGTSKFRRAYDSVDPEFDDALPTPQEIEQDFYGIFNKYFALNARWSERKHVPPFGDAQAQRCDVEKFYNFWYEFKSWREFSYLDEEDKEKGQDREERRWIEKENKAARIKRKKEEMQRIRALVDLAYNHDKRIAKFKDEDKQRKLAAKRAKVDAAQAQRIEQERAAREVQLQRERAEKAEQKRIEQIRIEREQMRRAIKKERKALRDRAKDCKYFASNDKEVVRNMEGIERICEQYTLAELQDLNREMLAVSSKCADIYYAAIKTLDIKLQMANEQTTTATTLPQSTDGNTTVGIGNGSGSGGGGSALKEVKKKDTWTNENVQLLIKAVNLFPAGTAQRWDVVSTFINQHANNGVQLSARDVLNKAKALQQSDFSKSVLKQQANAGAYESFEKKSKKLDGQQTCDDITVNNNNNHINNESEQVAKTKAKSKINATIKVPVSKDNDCDATETTTINHVHHNNCNIITAATEATPTTSMTTNPSAYSGGANSSASKTWTMEEQALLEQAIKTYPIQTIDRWERIAACIPNRNKKDCLRRVKELVELVNAKKEAKQAIK